MRRPPDAPRPRPPTGRGTPSNPAPRFQRQVREYDPAALAAIAALDPDLPPRDPATTVRIDPARTILATNESPDVPFRQSINPYRGCEHGCVYCFARPTHAWLDHSPGLDFETKLYAKPDAAALLDAAFRRPGYRPDPIALGTNTDPYQPVERELGITRALLAKCLEFRHPVTVVTKGTLVLRDLDLLGELARLGLAAVFVSVTTLDPALKRRLEPRAASPAARLRTIEALAAAGVPVGAMVAPVIPALTDHEIEAILAAVARAGATRAAYVLLRLPLEVRDLFVDWLGRHAPLRAARVMARIRDVRGGRENDSRFGARMRGEGAYAETIRARFHAAARRHGLEGRDEPLLDLTKFRVPPAGGQLALWQEP